MSSQKPFQQAAPAQTIDLSALQSHRQCEGMLTRGTKRCGKRARDGSLFCCDEHGSDMTSEYEFASWIIPSYLLKLQLLSDGRYIDEVQDQIFDGLRLAFKQFKQSQNAFKLLGLKAKYKPQVVSNDILKKIRDQYDEHASNLALLFQFVGMDFPLWDAAEDPNYIALRDSVTAAPVLPHSNPTIVPNRRFPLIAYPLHPALPPAPAPAPAHSLLALPPPRPNLAIEYKSPEEAEEEELFTELAAMAL